MGLENESMHSPKDFMLNQNYPTPLNTDIKISWYLAGRSHVILKVFDFMGRKIRTLVDENQSAPGYF